MTTDEASKLVLRRYPVPLPAPRRVAAAGQRLGLDATVADRPLGLEFDSVLRGRDATPFGTTGETQNGDDE